MRALRVWHFPFVQFASCCVQPAVLSCVVVFAFQDSHAAQLTGVACDRILPVPAPQWLSDSYHWSHLPSNCFSSWRHLSPAVLMSVTHFSLLLRLVCSGLSVPAGVCLLRSNCRRRFRFISCCPLYVWYCIRARCTLPLLITVFRIVCAVVARPVFDLFRMLLTAPARISAAVSIQQAPVPSIDSRPLVCATSGRHCSSYSSCVSRSQCV